MSLVVAPKPNGTTKRYTSKNLRGLYTYAKRVADNMSTPLYATVSTVQLLPIEPRTDGFITRVRVQYLDGAVGVEDFVDTTIARLWAERFARTHGGEMLEGQS